MTLIGRTWRAIPLGIKLDECPSCQTIGPHAVARRVRWFEVLRLQLVRLGSDHALICGKCGLETPIAGDVVKAGLKAGTLKIDRQRPLVDAQALQRCGQGDGSAAVSLGGSAPKADPGEIRATYDRRLREVLPIKGPKPTGRVRPHLACLGHHRRRRGARTERCSGDPVRWDRLDRTVRWRGGHKRARSGCQLAITASDP